MSVSGYGCNPADPSPIPADTSFAAHVGPFDLDETTISQLQERIASGELTCRAIAEMYLERIDALNTNGPRLHAVLETNPDALRIADELDQELAPESIQWYMNSPTLYSQSAYPTDWDWHNVDIYNMGVFRYESIYIGIPAFFHRFGPGKPGEGPQFAFTTFPLVCSRDLHHWTRVAERQPFMRPSYMGSGAFDLAKSQPPSNAIVRDGELWFYYNGLKYSGWSPKPDFQDQDGGAVCLAVLRRDGFLSLDAGNEEGTLVTHTLSLPPRTSRLFVNLVATGGELSVALLDPAGQPLDPFRAVEVVPRPGTGTRDRPLPRFSDPIGGDHLAAEVCWKGKSDISEVAGREVRLRFRLRRTQLFSYWFA